MTTKKAISILESDGWNLDSTNKAYWLGDHWILYYFSKELEGKSYKIEMSDKDSSNIPKPLEDPLGLRLTGGDLSD